MKEAYTLVEVILQRLYREVEDKKENITYYFRRKRLVASKHKNGTINMYFAAEPNEIWNHNGYALVTIAQNFRIVNHINITEHDVITVRGMIGTINRLQKLENSLLTECFDHSVVSFPWYKSEDDFLIGSIGEAIREKGNIVLSFSDVPIHIIVSSYEWKGVEDLNYNLFKCKRKNLDYIPSDNIYTFLRRENFRNWELGRKNYDYLSPVWLLWDTEDEALQLIDSDLEYTSEFISMLSKCKISSDNLPKAFFSS